MKRFTYTLALLTLTPLFFTGCVIQDDRYNTQPQQPPAGYQYIFNEDFTSDTRGWAFDDQKDSAYAFVSNGMYKFVDYSFTGGYHIAAVQTNANVYRNFKVQTRIKSNYAMALVFGASNNDYGYSFFVDEAGYFALYKEGVTPQVIIDWQHSSVISSDWNDLELEQIGDYWYGYINGVKVLQTPARTLNGSQIGYMVLANTTGFADYLTVKW